MANETVSPNQLAIVIQQLRAALDTVMNVQQKMLMDGPPVLSAPIQTVLEHDLPKVTTWANGIDSRYRTQKSEYDARIARQKAASEMIAKDLGNPMTEKPAPKKRGRPKKL